MMKVDRIFEERKIVRKNAQKRAVRPYTRKIFSYNVGRFRIREKLKGVTKSLNIRKIDKRVTI